MYIRVLVRIHLHTPFSAYVKCFSKNFKLGRYAHENANIRLNLTIYKPTFKI